MSENVEIKYAMALDPVHVGTGGYELGRVDNTIVREPGTKVPKIPGSTLNGAARTYSYYSLQEEDGQDPDKACAMGKKTKKEAPCGDCSLCNTYGYTKGNEGSKRSQVNFSDARILLFPVHSMKGPVWITCPDRLEELDSCDNVTLEDESKIRTNIDGLEDDKLNLGWLYLKQKNELNIDTDKLENIPEQIRNKIVLISDKVFSQVVNSNLEVRTSVSIDPETGAAEKSALFTYEAIPRTTIFRFEITYNEFSDNEIDVENIVIKGLKKFETLGVGGMTSRGLGRVRVLNLNNQNEE